ncbi:hypothetical protein HOU03_gp108 [Caulobacter phage CcrSC]|uniref:Uncharacterized protein n=1 Tax=Caulobacter phage CcrSC TaxID=2283272 RepID=A0A385EDF5_9CAUD|nr:hypothetical protein HOU03_gp108 [Caulobacter phage CcrSC]AXQ69690.1 hypothetical protein CcrSC_gp108 [Caulobacter phage CcrSC]
MIESPYEDRVKEVLSANTAWELAELFMVISEENAKLRSEWRALIAENQATLADSAQAIKVLVDERDEARAAQALAEEKYAKLAEVAGGQNLDEQIRRAKFQREMDGLRKALGEARAWALKERLIEPDESALDIIARLGTDAFVHYGTKP